MSRWFLLPLLVATACAMDVSDDASSEEDLTTETAMIGLLQSSQEVVYANVKSTASKSLSDALVHAAARGVAVRVVLAPGSHDTTWLLQQHLESSGVDCDVHSAIAGVTMVADDKALVSGKIVSTSSTVAADKKKFATLLDGSEPGSGSLLSSGVVVHAMPESARDRIVEVIDAAHSTIDLEIYQLQELRVTKALTDASARGVKVRVMLEPKTVGAANYTAMSATLSSHGITVRKTPAAFDSSHNVDHAKFMIVDGKELLVGTGNLVRSGLGGVSNVQYANRDFWIEDARSASLSEASTLFEADWAQRSTTSTPFTQLVVTPDNADARILALIDGAKTRLDVYNQSLKDATLVQHLITAKKRGVDVRVLLGYQPGFGGNPPDNQAAIDQLTAAGVEAKFLESHYLHAKAIVADSSVYLGSQNFTSGGLANNREVGEILTDSKSVSLVEQTFASDF